MKSKTKDVICHDCSIKFSVSDRTYYTNRKKDGIFRCQDCRRVYMARSAKQYASTLTDEERASISAKQSASHKARLTKLSKEENRLRMAPVIEAGNKFRASLSDDEKQSRLQILWDAHNLYIQSRSDEEKDKLSKDQSNRMKDRWETMHIDERNHILGSLQSGWNLYYNSLSKEKKDERMMNLIDAYSKWYEASSSEWREQRSQQARSQWNKLSIKEKEAKLTAMRLGYRKWFDSLSDTERYTHLSKMWESNMWAQDTYTDKIGPTEYDFNNMLQKSGLICGIHYDWGYRNKFVDDEYYNHFNDINPVTKENTYHYHQWDFIIYSISNKNIIIDLDGSIHHPKNSDRQVTSLNGIKFSMYDNIKYYDSKRPYQTDGLDAYIIEAYDDKLDDNTRVLSIQTGKYLKYSQLIDIILFSQLNLKDIEMILHE